MITFHCEVIWVFLAIYEYDQTCWTKWWRHPPYSDHFTRTPVRTSGTSGTWVSQSTDFQVLQILCSMSSFFLSSYHSKQHTRIKKHIPKTLCIYTWYPWRVIIITPFCNYQSFGQWCHKKHPGVEKISPTAIALRLRSQCVHFAFN